VKITAEQKEAIVRRHLDSEVSISHSQRIYRSSPHRSFDGSPWTEITLNQRLKNEFLKGILADVLPSRAHFLPNGNHNPGERRLSQLVLPNPGGVCHVESIFLGPSEPAAARTHRGRACHGPGSHSGPKVQKLCELSRPKP
jgi:hypothetical protein